MKNDAPSPPVTQADLARSLGIGQRTVSRAFGSGGPIRAALKARILAEAERLGYRPDAGARALRTGRFRNAVLVQAASPVSSHLPPATLAGLHDGLATAGYALAIARLDDADLLHDEGLPLALAQRGADGLVLNYDTRVPASLARLVERHRLPVVWLNSRRPADAVYHDDLAAGRLAAQALLAQGARSLVHVDLFLGWEPETHYSRQDRLEGLRSNGDGRPVQLFVPRHPVPGPEQAEALGALIARLPAPCGLACYGAEELGIALVAALRLGRTIPGQVCLACFTDDHLVPPLPCAVVRLDARRAGEQVARCLLDRIAGGPERPAEAIAPRLDGSTSLPGHSP